jgi:hypothetical protein
VLQPASFFGGILRQGDFINPLIFAIICYEVSAILGGILGLIGGNRDIGDFISGIILGPIGTAIGLFILAGILHLLTMLIIGSRNGGFEATFRVVSYSSVTSLLSWIPYIGWIAGLYGLYLAIVGVREVHTTTTGKAALVVLIPAVIVVLLALTVAAALVAIFFGMQR